MVDEWNDGIESAIIAMPDTSGRSREKGRFPAVAIACIDQGKSHLVWQVDTNLARTIRKRDVMVVDHVGTV